MHFLFFSPQYLPTPGGVERYTYNLTHQLCSLGHAVTILTSSLPGLPSQDIAENGTKIIRIPSFSFMNGRFPIPKPGAYKYIQKHLSNTVYDFVVIQTRFYPLCILASKYVQRYQIPTIVIEHGTKHLSLDNPLLNIAGNAYEHTAMKYVKKKCPHFYGVSKACCQWLLHFHIKASGVLYNSIDIDALLAEKASVTRDMRNDLNITPGSPLIVFIGRLIKEKGIFELVDAFASVIKKHPTAVLAIVGDGPALSALQNKTTNQIVFCGTLSHPDILSLLSSCNIFCLPTYSEGFSSVILEAAALKCCIATTPTGGSPELIQNSVSGFLFESKNIAELEKALCYALENPSLCKSMGKEVYKNVTTQFSWQKTAQNLLTISAKEQSH